ncbi:hypothetical protein DFR67_105302 [Williamsia limnetica]|uniref:DUF3068 family protein n=1 Tax=Williamsia limnetica TaxID=882452 RepID=A0A318S3D1_WILLI|nr:DUF3068 domain-containing protein [Williamsia limnetica]PYE18157.1 hypothetical protein DFR67_105302 [Williamsia limnetica]
MATGPRMSARDLAGPVAIFFGVLLIVVAIALPLYYVGTLKKTPMDLDITSVADSQGQQGVSESDALPAKIFNRCSLDEPRPQVSDAKLTEQQRVLVVDPADANKATFQAGNSIRIDSYTDGDETVTPPAQGGQNDCMTALLTATRDRITTNRTTAEPQISGGGQSEVQVDAGENSVSLPDRQGLQYRFPFGVDKGKTYTYFDLPSRTTNPLQFVDETEINGINTYHFTQEVPETDLSTLTDANDQQLAGTSIDQPAGWYGGFEGYRNNERLPASLIQTTTRDLYVDPVSGTIINEREHIKQEFKLNVSDDSPQAMLDYRLTALDVVFSYTQSTQEQLATDAKDLGSPIKLWGRWIPIGVGILGVVLLAAGVWLLLRGPNSPAPATGSPYGPSDPDEQQRTDLIKQYRGDAGARDTGGQHPAPPYDPDQTRQIPAVRDNRGGSNQAGFAGNNQAGFAENNPDGFAEVGDQYPYLDQQNIGQQGNPPVRDPGWTVPDQDPPQGR